MKANLEQVISSGKLYQSEDVVLFMRHCLYSDVVFADNGSVNSGQLKLCWRFRSIDLEKKFNRKLHATERLLVDPNKIEWEKDCLNCTFMVWTNG